MKKLMLLAVLAAMVGFMTGCEGSGDDPRVRFVNRSNHLVTVRPDGDLFWSAFTLGVGQRQTITGDSRVFFDYEPKKHVTADVEDGRVTFRNHNVEEVGATY